MNWNNLDIFSFPEDNKLPENWEINLFSKFQAAKDTGKEYEPAINETALFIANNTDAIKQDELMNLLNKIEKKFSIPVIDILKKAEAYKPKEADEEDEEDEEPERPNALQKAVKFIKEKYTTLHVNSLTGEIMYYKNNRLCFLDMETLFTELEFNNISVNSRKLFSYFYSPHYTPHTNPIKEILESFPKWDSSQPDFIRETIGYLKLDDNNTNFDITEHTYNMFLKSMVRTLENGLSENIRFPNKQIIIFKGGQNSRKTSFVRWFMSAFQKYTACDINLNPKDIDTKKAIASNLFIFNDEFDKMTHNQLNNFKILTVLDNVKYKPAYRYTEKIMQRRASFITTTDKNYFINDNAGNVRYIIISLLNDFKTPIPANLLNNIELSKLIWSQAYYYYKLTINNQFDNQLTSEEIHKNNQINSKFFIYKDLNQALQTFYPPSYNCDCTRLNATELINEINQNPVFPKHLISGITAQGLGRILTNYGYVQDNHTEGRIYKYKFQNIINNN